jgi:hypothetical protein
MNRDEKDWLNRLMKDDAAYIEDGGFTDRVTAALPPRRRFNPRTLILVGSAVVACVSGLVLLPGGQYLTTVAEAGVRAIGYSLSFSTASLGLLAAIAILAALFAAEEA